MFGLFFGWRGRIGRLKWFGAGIAWFVVAVIWLSSAGAVASTSPGVAAILFLAFLLTGLWVSFAINAKRLRDLGRSPMWHFAPLGALFLALLTTGSSIVTAGAMRSAAAVTAAIYSGGMLMVLVNLFTLGFFCYLAFWPGRAHDEPSPSSSGGGSWRDYEVRKTQGSARLEAAFESAMAQRAAASLIERAPGAVARPMAAAGGARAGFGRRR